VPLRIALRTAVAIFCLYLLRTKVRDTCNRLSFVPPDVLIIDSAQGGKAYTPAEFATFYKDARK
jgi:hypothetical protein